MLTAAQLHSRGLEESNAGRHASGRRILRQALGRAHDSDVLARIRLSLAHLEAEFGSADYGLDLCASTLELDGVSKQVRGLVYSQLGLLQMRAGNSAQALPAFAEAIRLLDSSAEPLATVHMNRGLLYLQRGSLQQATHDLELALWHARRGELALLTAKAQHNLGYVRLLAGDLISALSMMEAARPSWALSPVYAATCDQDRAEVLLAAGMTQDAATALEAAARSFGQRRLRQRQAEAEFVLARLLLLDEPSRARTVARRACRRFGSRGSPAWAVRADAVALAAELAVDGASADVLRRIDDVATQLRRLGLRHEASALSLHAAAALLRRDDLAEVRERVRSARIGPRAPLTSRLLDREVRCCLARRQGRRSDALRHLRQGLADLHAWQSSYGSLDLQSSLVGHGRRLADQGMALAIDDGRPGVVFEWSERARALASRIPPVRPPDDVEAAVQLSDLRRLRMQISAAQARGQVPPSLHVQAAELSARIRQRAWYDEGSGAVTEPVELDTVVDALDAADGALISYLAVDGQLHALVASAQRSTVVALGALADVRGQLNGMQADLDMAAADLPGAMRSVIMASLAKRLGQLNEALVVPLREAWEGQRLVVVPAGSLAGVPWTMLPGLTGLPLTVPRSASSWLAAREGRAASRTAGFVAGPGVDRAVDEVVTASLAWGSTTSLLGSDARAAAVGELASRVDVFHVAAHGRHSADNPLFSGLELADGPWFGYDIDRLDAIPSTVILSACELGRSSVRWGEETIGMTVAWLHAGARCVIASPAIVRDEAAGQLLSATHARLAVGVEPSQALAEATADVDADAPSPFMCFGAGW